MPHRNTRALFAATIFLGSFLLFASEPIQGKMLLPLLGGAPAVWNTCLLFFQAVLLLSYLYAHALTTKLRPRTQVLVHAAVLAVPAVFLPVAIPSGLTASEWLQTAPVGWLLLTMTMTVGPAFFAVAATSPLLQSWFVRLGFPQNPYALYAASNAGSLLALVSYPFVVEPELATREQTWIWALLYGGLALLCMTAGFIVFRRVRHAVATSEAVESDTVEDVASAAPREAEDDGVTVQDVDEWTRGSFATLWLAWRERLLWVVLAAVPSSLMLGVTTFLTTDIAAIPLLWILPLALYTLSFVLVFARYDERNASLVGRGVPLAVAAMFFLIFTEYRQNLWITITAHLAAFFILAVACHGRLALARPAPAKLTSYYFYMALGGVLGGALNTLAAPAVFDRIVEYPLMVVLAGWLCYAIRRPAKAAHPLRLQWAGVAAVLGAAVMYAMLRLYKANKFAVVAAWVGDAFSEEAVEAGVVYGVPTLLVLLLAVAVRRVPVAPGLAAGATLVALFFDLYSNTLHQSRSFFGVLTVRRYDETQSHTLVHGGIMHGEQWRATEDDRAEPRSYYHREGPLGQIMDTLDREVEFPRIAAIGLGAGTVAAYGHSTNAITFYELNPHVETLARDPRLFTYVDDCLRRWCNLDVVIGDGRLKLAEAADFYDLIVVDAFSSDAIPIHLVTLEALKIYFAKITASGLVAFHISNRYVDLEPVLLNLAKELDLGYGVRHDEGDDAIGKGGSTWVLLAAKEGLFEKIAVDDERWTGLDAKDGIGLWRDDFANVARAFIWN